MAAARPALADKLRTEHSAATARLRDLSVLCAVITRGGVVLATQVVYVAGPALAVLFSSSCRPCFE